MENGLLSNSELVDTLIVDLNNLPKHLMTGQNIQFCNTVSQMAQKLFNLRTGIKADLDNKDKVIESLKETIRNMGEGVKDVSIEEYMEKYAIKDGAENGTD